MLVPPASRRTRRPGPLALAIGFVLIAFMARAARAGDPADPTRDFESPRFEVRRGAEKALYDEGYSILTAKEDDADVEPRRAALDAALDACERSKSPGAIRAVARVVAHLERAATDDQIRRMPRLLGARLDRQLPFVVLDDATIDAGPDVEPDNARDARASSRELRGLFPQARPLLLERIRTSRDARTLAGALAVLCPESGGGIDDQADLDAIGLAWESEPSRFDGLGRFHSVDGAPPLAAVVLALALTGRARSVQSVLRADDQVEWSIRSWLEPRLKARADGDLTMGSFLARLEQGLVMTDEEVEAARLALDVGSLPWLARLLARRALFLDPSREDARRLLVRASEGVGLRSGERLGGKPAGPGEGGVDDAASVIIDDALRAGRLSQRLAYQIDVESDYRRGLVCVAFDGARLIHSTLRGVLRVRDLETGSERFVLGQRSPRAARSIAARDGALVEVSGPGALRYWSLGNDGAKLAHQQSPGAFEAAVATNDAIYAASFGFVLHRVTKDGIEKLSNVKPVRRFVVKTFEAFADDTLLVASSETAWRVDPSTGRSTAIQTAEEATVTVCGDDVLVFSGESFVRLDRKGVRTGGGPVPDGGVIQGVVAERDGSVAYVQTIDSLYAIDPKDGSVRWVEHVEGSGAPVVGQGFVVARAGNGSMQQQGDGREDRTLYLLRAATSIREPFGVAERARLVSIAVAAATRGEAGVVRALIDPVLGWLSAEEGNAIERAIVVTPSDRGDEPSRDGGR